MKMNKYKKKYKKLELNQGLNTGKKWIQKLNK